MFRVTTHRASDQLILKFEGRLTGAWVGEADACWRDAIAAQAGLPIVVDLCDVSVVDPSGRALLVQMYRGGAEFSVRGCVMRELVREIAQAVSHRGGFEEGRNA
jgi:ABC-type transporter Mla MlaB component